MAFDGFPYDPADPSFVEDPYAVYDRLRSTSPVHRVDATQVVLSRYADCVQTISHPDASVDHRNSAMAKALKEKLGWDPFVSREGTIQFLDQPEHTRLRALVRRAFTTQTVSAIADEVQRIVDEMLEYALASGGLEAVEDFAYVVPVRVIAALFGIPPEDHHVLKECSRLVSRAVDQGLEVSPDIAKAVAELAAYLAELVRVRRERPGDDLVTALLRVRDASGDTLSEAELHSFLLTLVVAGHETTANLIANLLLQLVTHPDTYRSLREDPASIRGAIEETLRFDPPVHMVARTLKAETKIAGQVLDTGTTVTCLTAAANRDPDEFGDTAGEFRIGRAPNNHLTFGTGIHFCLGANLGRLEATVVLATFARRIASFKLDGRPVRRQNLVVRGLTRLPLALKAP